MHANNDNNYIHVVETMAVVRCMASIDFKILLMFITQPSIKKFNLINK